LCYIYAKNIWANIFANAGDRCEIYKVSKKNMKNTVSSLVTIGYLTVLFFAGCATEVNKKNEITLVNTSGNSIGYYFALGGKFGNAYPDTILPAYTDYVGKELKSNKTFHYLFGGGKEALIKALPKDTLSVYIFSTDTLSKYTWDEVRSNYKVLKRYDLSLQDLNELNWTITYVPSIE
jgi:hypothetical protein